MHGAWFSPSDGTPKIAQSQLTAFPSSKTEYFQILTGCSITTIVSFKMKIQYLYWKYTHQYISFLLCMYYAIVVARERSGIVDIFVRFYNA